MLMMTSLILQNSCIYSHLYSIMTSNFNRSDLLKLLVCNMNSGYISKYLLRVSLSLYIQGELANHSVLQLYYLPHRSSLEYIMCGIFGYCSFLKEKVSSS